jgi:2-oxoglutarate ferredoxin oxidoreductase subunit gamma
MVRDRLEVRLAGSGGQGVVLAGVILAEAAAGSGLGVSQFQAYGPASRGGASWTDVIVARGPVRYPKPSALDVLVALTQEACDASLGQLRAGGLVLFDSGRVAPPQRGDIEPHALPFGLSAEQVGSRQAANLVALGALVALTSAVGEDALEKAALAHVPERSREVNLRALRAGRLLVEAANGS